MWMLLFACLETRNVGQEESGLLDTGSGVETDPAERIDPADLPAAPSPCREPILVRVNDVVDGDTAWVDNGTGSEKIRFIGIDAPEMSGGGECFSSEATHHVRERLEGRHVWLTFDSECEDHYGRTLAYLHTAPSVDGFVQRELLRGGWVSTFAVRPNTAFEETFSGDQQVAQAADAGVWGACR
jgi:micrococcal nuclease